LKGYTKVSLSKGAQMRFTGVKELKHRTMDILKETEKEDVIITSYGKPMAVLHHITEDDLADYLIENDPAFKTRIEEAYAEYEAQGGAKAVDLIKRLEKRRGTKKI
jgi:antitoxin (DNA-binding transcriptional repressor) of toxin-antitoxin stability system